MLKTLRQVFCNHDWVYGKAASREALQQFKTWNCWHNRVCAKCDQIDMAADRAEKELDRIMNLRSDMQAFRDPSEILWPEGGEAEAASRD